MDTEGSFLCVDIDECALETDDCTLAQECQNTTNGWTCAAIGCDPACDVGTSTCVEDPADTFTCVCLGGYEDDGEGGCQNVDECADGTDDCAEGYECVDTVGDFTCNEIDECAEDADNCDANATCDNTAGGFTCECNDGYVGDGVSCELECGNGEMDTGEQCDDGNATRWDGCHECRFEQVFRVTDLTMLATTPAACANLPHRAGTDFNVIGAGLTTLARNVVNDGVQTALDAGSYVILSHPLDLDDTEAAILGQSDTSIRLAFFQGAPSGTFSPEPNAPFVITSSGTQLTGGALDPHSDRILAPGELAASVLSAGAGTGAVTLPVDLGAGPSPLRLYNVLVQGTTSNDGTRTTDIMDGILCGTVPASDLDTIAVAGTLDTFCPDRSVLDVVGRGCGVLVNETQPNVDLAGDGIQATSLSADSGNIVNICFDGTTNTRIPAAGTDDECAQDPAFDDGFGVAYSFTAIYVRFDGTTP